MENITKDQFENILCDVRKAYRLLFLYQKRILDLIQFIASSLDFKFGGGWNWWTLSSLPHGSKVKLANSSWDWLSMYFYEFNFCEKNIDNNIIKFSVILESDTGYFDTMVSSENVHRIRLRNNQLAN